MNILQELYQIDVQRPHDVVKLADAFYKSCADMWHYKLQKEVHQFLHPYRALILQYFLRPDVDEKLYSLAQFVMPDAAVDYPELVLKLLEVYSIQGLHIDSLQEVLVIVASHHPKLLKKFFELSEGYAFEPSVIHRALFALAKSAPEKILTLFAHTNVPDMQPDDLNDLISLIPDSHLVIKNRLLRWGVENRIIPPRPNMDMGKLSMVPLPSAAPHACYTHDATHPYLFPSKF